MKYFLLLGLCFSCFLSGKVQALTQAELAEFARNTELKFAVLSNFTSHNSGKILAELSLRNNSSVDLKAGADGWILYFHSIRKLDAADQHGLTLKHVQGDLHSIRPGKSFKGLQAGQVLRLQFSPS